MPGRHHLESRFPSHDLSVRLKQVLLVEPDAVFRTLLLAAAAEHAIDGHEGFSSARPHVVSRRYGWLVTNLRLNCYNGLHLVHIARNMALPMRLLVYADRLDPFLAREAQQLGAFYESSVRIGGALASYLDSELPPNDRRDPAATVSRHTIFRGGQRCTDRPSCTPH